MRLGHLWLTDFRNYDQGELEPAPDGLTVIVGPNGEGKTNLLEGVGYLATLSSFRGAPTEALVRAGADRAVLRAEGEREGRRLLLEAEISATGRHRTQVNRQPLRRARDLLGALRVSVFSPDDLALVKGGPAERRRYLDDALVAVHPRNDTLRSDLDRVLRQRNVLLRQAGGRMTADITGTLDVWDAKLAAVGSELAAARRALVADLEPALRKAYDDVAQAPSEVELVYQASWQGDLGGALQAARAEDVKRGTSTVGPHRDDAVLRIGGLAARTHASQGEQRSLALGLRLAAHGVVTAAVGAAPILLLDDVFSELDADRSAALLASLPPGQSLLTTAGATPPGVRAALTVHVRAGRFAA